MLNLGLHFFRLYARHYILLKLTEYILMVDVVILSN